MLGLILSILLLLVGIIGTILTLSVIINSYQQKKLEYMAYRNQAKARNVLESDTDSLESNIYSEEQYYKSKGFVNGAIDISFVPRAIKQDFFKPETYTKILRKSSTEMAEKLSKVDLGVAASQTRITATKIYKYLKTKYSELISFLIKINEPIESNQLESDRSSARSALATSSRIKNLNRTFRDFSDKGQAMLKSRFSKAKLNVWPNQQDEILMDKQLEKSFNRIDSKDKEDPQDEFTKVEPTTNEMYIQLEEDLLEKLHENLNDFDMWESLGDFYQNHNEKDKANEVYNYIQKHTQNDTQLLRINKKKMS